MNSEPLQGSLKLLRREEQWMVTYIKTRLPNTASSIPKVMRPPRSTLITTTDANHENNVTLSEFIFILITTSVSVEMRCCQELWLDQSTLWAIKLYRLVSPWKTDRKGKIINSLSCSATTTEPSKDFFLILCFTKGSSVLSAVSPFSMQQID